MLSHERSSYACAFVYVLMVGVLGLGAAFISACSADGDEITSYPMFCDKPLTDGKCKGNSTPLNREIFRVYASSQQVVSWTPGVNGPPIRLEQCAVRDSRNWKCRYPRNQGEVGFTNGEYHEMLTPPHLEQDKFFHVGAVTWWWHQLVGSRF